MSNIEMISNLFEGHTIRSVWDADKEDYWISVIDVVQVLTNSPNPRNYWNMLKRRLLEEGSELYTKCVQLKLTSNKDGKNYKTDVLDTEGILRLIESIPSPKAEPFKVWLAKLGSKEIDSIYDPSIGIDRMLDYYLDKGYDLEWVERRFRSILNRKKLTETWKAHGVVDNNEFAILTNEIYKSWSGMTAKEYKTYKNLKRGSLRDNMSDIEVILTDLSEVTTKHLTDKYNPRGLEQNRIIAMAGGDVSYETREILERTLDKPVITFTNNYIVFLFFC